jgi:hypothetical protein
MIEPANDRVRISLLCVDDSKRDLTFAISGFAGNIAHELYDIHARYNIAPTQTHPIIGQRSGDRQQDDQRAVRDAGGKAGFPLEKRKNRCHLWQRSPDRN